MTSTRKTMSKEAVTDYVVQELASLGNLTTKNMFGGVGIFLDGVMFAKIAGDGTLSFRVDDTNRADYEQLGSEQFYSPDKKKGMPYYRVPDEILEDQSALIQWAHKAHAVALANKK